MDFNTILTFIACISAIFIVGRIFIIPLKLLFKLAINSILGGFIIFIINLIGQGFNFHIGLNVATSIFVGLLGIPRCNHFNINSNLFTLNRSYSTVTDLAKFLGLSTSKCFSFAT